MSVRCGPERRAPPLACHLEISASGTVTSWRFTRALVRIDEVIAYEEAQRRINNGDAGPVLTNLWAAWRALEQARNSRDPLALELPERRVVLDDAGKIREIALRERLDAHRVVEDFMIAANVAAAKALESKVSPVVYRIHEAPSREKLVALKDYLATFDRKLALGQVITPGLFNRMLKDVSDESEKALIMEAVLRSQTQAYYGPRNAGHFGLALGSYAHFTSPIRRYADLLVHRALVDAFGLEQPAPKSKLPPTSGLSDRDRADLSRVSDAISLAERRAMEAERDTIDRYVAAWLVEAGWVKCLKPGSPGSSALACSRQSSAWAETAWFQSRCWETSGCSTTKRRRFWKVSAAAPVLPGAIGCGSSWPKPIRSPERSSLNPRKVPA